MAYEFVAGWELSIVGTLQAAYYAIAGGAAGIFYYCETLTPVQLIGFVMAFAGSVMLSVE